MSVTWDGVTLPAKTARLGIVPSPNPHISFRSYTTSLSDYTALLAKFAPVSELLLQGGQVKLKGDGDSGTLAISATSESWTNCMLVALSLDVPDDIQSVGYLIYTTFAQDTSV